MMLHGDASFAGQINDRRDAEPGCCLGYRTGGTIHIVVNNRSVHHLTQASVSGTAPTWPR
jgi:2-oxoglutarate dehydrogenase complex dehydrogenase (E1) component-like enzyme